MSRILVLAEKPSVGRDYAKVLHCTERGDGCLLGKDYVVTWAVGHLIELCEPDAYNPAFKKWRGEDLPIIPETMKLQVIKSSKAQFQIIKKWMKDPEISSIICGTDSGREGELIFRYIYQEAGCKKPFQRLWVSSMTNEAITEGFNTLRPGSDYDSLYHSARCRNEGDWLVGMNASRAFTLHYNRLLSIGRVQTPTLAMLVERYKEIESFVPSDYWEVEAELDPACKAKYFVRDEEGKINTHIDEEAKANAIRNDIPKGTPAEVLEVRKTKKVQQPPLLFDLTELQREGNRRYGYSAAKTLSIAQDLYEKRKLITYPRTDSRYLSDDMKETVRSTLRNLNISDYHAALMGIPGLNFTGRIIDNSKITDHHAIIPTNKKPNLDVLSEDERRIYHLIAMRLITVFYPAYVYEQTEIEWKIREHRFLSKGKTILEPGYMKLEINQGTRSKSRKKEEEETVPQVEKGDQGKVVKNKLIANKTKPPQPYTEATLLSAMEYAGKLIEDEKLKETMKKMSLGTPATRASIIERLIKVGYVERKSKSLIPTEKGITLIEILPKELRSPEMTAKWERALERINQGTMDPTAFIESIRRYVAFIVGAAKTSPEPQNGFPEDTARKGRKSVRGLGTCPICGKGKVLKNTKSYYCSNWNQGCKLTVWLDSMERYGNVIDDALIKDILKNKESIREVTLPQTGEKGTGTFYFSEKGSLEMKNFKKN